MLEAAHADAQMRNATLQQQLDALAAKRTQAPRAPRAATPARQAGAATMGMDTRVSGYGIDTKALGKPEAFASDEAKWRDWKVIASTYFGLVCPALLQGLRRCEEVAALQQQARPEVGGNVEALDSLALVNLSPELESGSR